MQLVQDFGLPPGSHPMCHRMHLLRSFLVIGIHKIGLMVILSRHARSSVEPDVKDRCLSSMF